MRYSLSTHILSISSSSTIFNTLFNNVKIGGEGDALSSISISRTDSMWDTKSYATGAWVHTHKLSKVGSVSVSLSQLTAAVGKFKQCCNYYFDSSKIADDIGLTLTLTEAGTGRQIAVCTDCYIDKIPDQAFGESAAEQNWSFTCGQVDFI